MHNIDIGLIEMTLDITKHVIHRITERNPVMGRFRSEATLKKQVGETITPEGIGGEKAFHIWKTILSKASAPIDHPRHLAFVPAAPTRTAIMFDLVTSASSIHGTYWMEGPAPFSPKIRPWNGWSHLPVCPPAPLVFSPVAVPLPTFLRLLPHVNTGVQKMKRIPNKKSSSLPQPGCRDADGFNPSDYQIQLTRRVRGLPLWFSLAMHGTNRYKQAIERGIELAHIAADKIRQHPDLELVREPGLSCVLFRRKGWRPEDYSHWTFENLNKGFALVAPTKWREKGKTETVTRFCFINPDTTEEDIDAILRSMEK